MAVITITRQYGAGGSRVAQLAARALGWTVIDNGFVDAVAAKAGISAEVVAAREERAPSLVQRLIRALAATSPEMVVAVPPPREEADEQTLVRTTERVIDEAAQVGHVVLVGRGAQAYLSGTRGGDALHAFLVAPLDTRVQTVMERLTVDAAEAGRVIAETDAARDRYVQRHYGRARQEPATYHMTLNTGLLGLDGAADLLVAAARARNW